MGWPVKKWDKKLVSKLRKKWWWLRSEKELKKFEDDPWGQAFELFRRLPEYKKENLFMRFSGLTWKSLSKVNKADFRLTYRYACVRKGLFPAEFFGGDRGITFDCRASGNSVLDALDLHLDDPAPFCSVVGPTFRSKSRLGAPDVSHIKPENPNKDLFEPPKVGLGDPFRIYVPFPEIKDEKVVGKKPVRRTRAMFRKEIITHVRKIIKQDKNYQKYRAIMIEEFGALPHRSRVSPRSRILKIMAIDAENEGLNTSDLGRLLDKYFPTNILFCACGSKLQRRLYHAKSLII